jgi:hypothetical protein
LQAVEETCALRSEDVGSGAEGGETAVAKEQNFSRGCECVGGVVSGHDGLHFAFTQPTLQADEQRIAGDAVEC